MTNAKEEFLNETKGCKVIGVKIIFGGAYHNYNDELEESFTLPLLYGDEEWEEFLDFLDREYDSGFGGQNLFGEIYCEDNIWFDRYEYDGSESWDKHEYPDLSKEFGEKEFLKYERYIKLKKIGE